MASSSAAASAASAAMAELALDRERAAMAAADAQSFIAQRYFFRSAQLLLPVTHHSGPLLALWPRQPDQSRGHIAPNDARAAARVQRMPPTAATTVRASWRTKQRERHARSAANPAKNRAHPTSTARNARMRAQPPRPQHKLGSL